MAQEATITNRRKEVAEHIALKGFVSLNELTESLHVSESTVRRDLEVLEEQGAVRRTHGGAVSLAEPMATRLAFADRETTAVAEKRAIAAEIARRIPENQTVILSGGTTCWHVAAALLGRRLSVITNSVPIATLLGGEINTEVTLLGGYLYPRTGIAVGAMAENMLGALRAAQTITSCAAANPDGIFDVNEMMASVERRMIESADEVILVVDHTKFNKRAIAPLCGWSDVDLLVTDAGVSEDDRRWVENLGVKMLVAGASS